MNVRSRFRFASIALVAGLGGVASAQPDPTPTPQPGPTDPQPEGAPAVPPETDPADQPAPEREREPEAAPEAAPVDPVVVTATAGTAVMAPAPEAASEEQNIRGQSGFMDVRLNLTLTNENLFAEPGETIPSVPGWRFGRPNSLGTLFFDNYDTRFSGYETLSHAVLYRNYKKEHLEVEGALVIRVNDLAERKIDLSDAGSYILVGWWKDPTHQDPTRLTLTAFPTSSDRFRLGYSYRLSWGGSDEFRRTTQSVPGVKLQYDQGNAYAFVGAKSAVMLDSASAEQTAVMSFLAGAGVDVNEKLRIEVNGGYFDRGSNELQDVLEEHVQLYGGSLQVAYHEGMPVSSSIDYQLYRNDPERVGRLFRKTEYPGGLSWLASGEITAIGQTLKDPENTGSTTTQIGRAGDINLRAKYDRTRVRLDLQYRDLAFILHSTPSLPTYSDFPMQYDKAGNYFAAAGIDQNFDDRLTLGVVIGVDKPATLTTPTGEIPGDTIEGEGTSTAVVRNEGDITILPAGEEVKPQVAVKFTGRLDFAEMFAGIVDVYYVRDPNQTRLTREGPEDQFVREFGEFNQLGINATLQARF